MEINHTRLYFVAITIFCQFQIFFCIIMEEEDICKYFNKSSCLGIKWQEMAENEINESPEVYKEEMALLKSFIAGDSNLSVPEGEDFIVRFLRARKFDSKKAFSMIQRYYIMKLKHPELFKCPLPSELNDVLDSHAQMMLNSRDQFGRRVFIIRVDKFDSSKMTIDNIFRTNIVALEQVVREPETQIAGIVLILDMAGLSLNHARFFTPYYAKKTVEVVQETFPLRFKGFHVVNEPFYFDAIMAVLKPFLKEKIRKRIFLHGNNFSSLHAFVKPDVLPAEYGGLCGPFNNEEWHNQLLSEENYFRKLEEYGYKTDNNEN